ncbi:hypothetical protein MIND_00411200 [Mycena indigotica]|uniref:Uncharacterized protein n=1 Tax=Mycena indigotica TaxID=2126181 RepID=A0A8H6SXL8_9AGAR|nr:uncharacterized protein MIND_00411200 [Mycena indigotica]KAF7306207.1 hypothetical protein MIND_00411200 [Mycena indigotica]
MPASRSKRVTAIQPPSASRSLKTSGAVKRRSQFTAAEDILLVSHLCRIPAAKRRHKKVFERIHAEQPGLQRHSARSWFDRYCRRRDEYDFMCEMRARELGSASADEPNTDTRTPTGLQLSADDKLLAVTIGLNVIAQVHNVPIREVYSIWEAEGCLERVDAVLSLAGNGSDVEMTSVESDASSSQSPDSESESDNDVTPSSLHKSTSQYDFDTENAQDLSTGHSNSSRATSLAPAGESEVDAAGRADRIESDLEDHPSINQSTSFHATSIPAHAGDSESDPEESPKSGFESDDNASSSSGAKSARESESVIDSESDKGELGRDATGSELDWEEGNATMLVDSESDPDTGPEESEHDADSDEPRDLTPPPELTPRAPRRMMARRLYNGQPILTLDSLSTIASADEGSAASESHMSQTHCTGDGVGASDGEEQESTYIATQPDLFGPPLGPSKRRGKERGRKDKAEEEMDFENFSWGSLRR